MIYFKEPVEHLEAEKLNGLVIIDTPIDLYESLKYLKSVNKVKTIQKNRCYEIKSFNSTQWFLGLFISDFESKINVAKNKNKFKGITLTLKLSYIKKEYMEPKIIRLFTKLKIDSNLKIHVIENSEREKEINAENLARYLKHSNASDNFTVKGVSSLKKKIKHWVQKETSGYYKFASLSLFKILEYSKYIEKAVYDGRGIFLHENLSILIDMLDKSNLLMTKKKGD